MKDKRRIISSFLALSILGSVFSALEVNAYAETIYSEESDAISDEIKDSGEFYVATPNIDMNEGSGAKYTAVIRRGGNELEAASVRLTILDITAQYGKDYRIEVPDKGFFERDVENTWGASSIYSLAQENDGKLDEVNGVDEIAEMNKTDEEIQEMYDESVQALSEGLSGEVQEYVEEKAEETGKSGEEILNEAAEKQGSLSSAFEEATGLKDDSAPMDGGTMDGRAIIGDYSKEKLEELAKQLDSPYIVLDFDEGETEKVIEIVPKDNNNAEGNKMFLANLFPETENAIISEMKGITGIIEDDEEWTEPTVEFAQSVYYPENGFADITIKRDGVLTDIAAVKLISSDGTAMGGRDYSQVDTTVVIPFGINERTIKIPVRSEYIDTAVNFNLTLSDAQNCTLGENSGAQGIVEANSVSYGDNEDLQIRLMEEDASVGDVIASDKEAIDHQSPYSTSAGDDSYTRAEGDDYVLHASTNVYDKVWARAYWNTKDKNSHYDYDGYQIDWTKESGSSCWTDNEVSIYYNGDWHTVWENTEERWTEKRTNNIYPKQNEFQSLKISVSQRNAFLSKAPTLKIHSIKPILRPFEITLMGAEKLKFRNENGEYVDYDKITGLGKAENALLRGANKEGTGTAVKFSGEQIIVTTDSSYAYISGLKIVHPSNGKSKVIRSGLATGTTSVSVDLTNDFIKENLEYINFTSNGGSRIKGQFMVQPVFNYYDATVRTHNDKRATIKVDATDTGEVDEQDEIKGTEIKYVTLYNPATKKYLSAEKGMNNNVTITDKISANTEWKMTPIGTNSYKIENPETGGILTLGNDPGDITKIKLLLSEDLGENNGRQLFKVETMSNGNVVFRSGYYRRGFIFAANSVHLGVINSGKIDNAGTGLQWQIITDHTDIVSPDVIIPDETINLHKGDTIRFTQVIHDNYKATYGSSRIWFVKRETSAGEAIDDKSLYNDGDNRYKMMIEHALIDAYVNLDKKDNEVTVRIAESDVDKFDTSTGIFTNTYTTDGGYREYTVVPPDKFSLNAYIEMQAKTKSDGDIAVWKTPWDGKAYSQQTFYFLTREENEDNVITLSCRRADSFKYSIVGTTHYSEVALAGQTEGASWRPAGGVYVYLDKDIYALSDDDGNFATVPVCGIDGSYVIYKTESNGQTKYGTVKLSGATTRQVDDGNGGTETVNAVSIGDIKTSVTDKNVPHASSFVAVNANGVANGNVALISNDITYMTATVMNNGSTYTDTDGKERTEKVKKVEFVIYDPITNQERSVVDGEAREIINQNGMSVWQMSKTFKKDESHLYTSSDKIYIRITTDRVKGNGKAYNEKGELVELDSLNQTIYPDVYTGYTLATTNTEKPVTHDLDIFDGNLDQFLTLPAIGSMNATFLIKSVTLTISELPEGGFRLGLGYAKGVEKRGTDDGGTEHKVPFTPDRIAHEFNKVKTWGNVVGPKDVVGFANGGVYPMFGIYLDFGLKSVTHLDDQQSQETDLIFIGGGAMLGALGNFRIVIYGAIGPVPVYFGVDGQLAAYINIGAKRKTKDTLGDGAIEYEDVTFQEIKSGDKKIQDSVLFDFLIEANGVLNVYVGAGIAGTFGIRGGASIGASLIYYPTITQTYDINPVGLQITVGLKIWVDLVLLSIPSPKLDLEKERYGYYKDIDRLKSNNPSLMSVASSGEQSEIQTDEYGAFLRKGSGKDEVWMPDKDNIQLMSTFEAKKTTILSEDGYENASPQLMDIGDGRILLVYLASDLSKGEYDRTSIVYSVYDNGQWKEPVKIDPNSTKGDFEPSLCDIGDKILVSWTSRNNDDNRTDSKDYLKGMNVFSTTIDKTTLEIGDIEQLTNDDYYNADPVGLYDEVTGDYAVYYLKSEVTDVNTGDTYEDSVGSEAGANLLTIASPTTNGAKLMYRLHNNANGWVTEKLSDDESVMATGERFVVSQIAELSGTTNSDSPRIIDFDAVSYDGKGVYAYTIDIDNNIDTMADRELYVQIYDFASHKTYKPIRITNDNYTDTEPQLVRNGEQTYLFWREDENTIRYISIANLVTNGLEDNETLKDQNAESDGTTRVYEVEQSRVFSTMENPDMTPTYANYKVFVDKDGNMFIAWTQGEDERDENGNITKTSLEVYASAYIKETATVDGEETALDSNWSEGIKLTDTGRYNDSIAVWTDEDGNLITVNNQYDIDETKSEATNITLVSTEYKTVGSAEIKDVRYYDTTPIAGSNNTVTIDVKNNGLKAMNGFTLKAYEVKNGNVSDTPVFETTSNERVTPSSIVPIDFDWQMPDSYDGINDLKLHISVQETGYDEIAGYDSESIEFKPEYVLHDVRTFQTMFGVMVRYEVENTGNVDTVISTQGDISSTDARVVMEYVDAYDTGAEDKIFLDIPVPPVKVGETVTDIDILDIPIEGYFKYGRLNSTVEVRDTDNNVLSQYPNIHVALEHPRFVGMDNEDILLDLDETRLTIPMKEGESYELNGSYTDTDYYEGGTVQFISSDPSVASVVDGKLYAVGAGTTKLTAAVYPFGGETDYYVTVEAAKQSTPTRRSGGGSSSYSVSTSQEEYDNGSLTLSKKTAAKGETVTIKAAPNEGYEVDTITVTDEKGNAIELTKLSDTEYSFVMPAGKVSVDISYKAKEPDATEKPSNDNDRWFLDVPKEAWYYGTVKEAFDAGRMSGVSDDLFEPENNITRGMFAYSIYNREGMPETDAVNTFDDVRADSYYVDAIAWATENKIVLGYDDTHYGPDDPITREQMAAMIWRYAKFKGYDVSVGEDTNILAFTDSLDISEYAVPAIEWAAGDGVITGFEDGTVRPKANANRAQLAVILNKIAELF